MDANENAQAFIQALRLDAAPSDTDRAQLLEALKAYADAAGMPALKEAAHAALPAAHPFRPPKQWKLHYLAEFEQIADPDCGVDPDEGKRYCREYWQSLTDEQRQERLADPQLGREDGQKDADALNEA